MIYLDTHLLNSAPKTMLNLYRFLRIITDSLLQTSTGDKSEPFRKKL